jgi:hypothetical protein
MPVKGAIVRRSKWFYEITQTLEDHGFKRGAPGVVPCPGFHYFSRDGYVVRILPENAIRITRPNGAVEIESVPRMSKANFILDAIVRYIELPRTA